MLRTIVCLCAVLCVWLQHSNRRCVRFHSHMVSTFSFVGDVVGAVGTAAAVAAGGTSCKCASPDNMHISSLFLVSRTSKAHAHNTHNMIMIKHHPTTLYRDSCPSKNQRCRRRRPGLAFWQRVNYKWDCILVSYSRTKGTKRAKEHVCVICSWQIFDKNPIKMSFCRNLSQSCLMFLHFGIILKVKSSKITQKNKMNHSSKFVIFTNRFICKILITGGIATTQRGERAVGVVLVPYTLSYTS